MFNPQVYYYREQKANFKAVSRQLLQKQDLKHCDTINCTRDNGIKIIYLKNILNRQIVEQKLCRDCRNTRHQKLLNAYLYGKVTTKRSVKFRYYF